MTDPDTSSNHGSRSSSFRGDLDALPGPPAVPLLGWFGSTAKYWIDPLSCLDELANGGYGDVVIFGRKMRSGIFRPGAGSPAAVLALGPAQNQQVLMNPAQFQQLFPAIPTGSPGFARLTSGILWMNGDQHRRQRRLMAPAFHRSRFGRYRDMLVSVTAETLDRWTTGAHVDVLDEAKRMLTGFLSQMLLGDEDKPQALSLAVRIDELTELWGSPLTMIPVNLPYTPRRALIEHAESLAKDLGAFIARKRAAKEDTGDALAALVRAVDEDGSVMTEDELLGQLFLLFAAGFGSSMAGLAWTAYLIAQHPKVAGDLHDEITATLRGDAPTLDQLAKMPLLDGVIKESMRILPPIFLLSRTAAEPVQLGRYTLPERTEVFVSLYHTHRSPDLYPEPRRFRPERWRSMEPDPFRFLPFGAGVHTCLGLAIAMMELKIMLAMMVQRYRLEVPRGARIDRLVLGTLAPKGGLRMRVRAQDRRFAESRAPDVRGDIATMVDI